MNPWDERYATSDYIFGREPSHVLKERTHLFQSGKSALSIADGEGRNGVFLARMGLTVHAVDASPVGLAKAATLAAINDVELRLEEADLFSWEWPTDAYDYLVSIMFNVAGTEQKTILFEKLKGAAKPGGIVLVHGFDVEHAHIGVVGPSDPESMFSKDILRAGFADFEIIELDTEIRDEFVGDEPTGQSALITLVARKPE